RLTAKHNHFFCRLAVFFACAVSLVMGSVNCAAAVGGDNGSTPKTPTSSAVAQPGTMIYNAQRGDSIPAIARHFLGKTSYLTSGELADAIRDANGRKATAT